MVGRSIQLFDPDGQFAWDQAESSASRRGHHALDTLDVLHGAIIGGDEASDMLQDLGISVESIVEHMDIFDANPASQRELTAGKAKWSSNVSEVIQLAGADARDRGEEIGPINMLRGIVANANGAAFSYLEEAGVIPDLEKQLGVAAKHRRGKSL